jgi:glycosyltransferase involved in cell wall biosynthesis
MMAESTPWDERRVGWKEWIKRRIVRCASAALVGGSPHADYMHQLGMPTDRIFQGYDAVDNSYFAEHSDNWREQGLRANKQGLESASTPVSHLSSPPCRPYFLASNRFIGKKNLFRLLEAYAGYLKGCQQAGDKDQTKDNEIEYPWDLCLLGDGELRLAILAHCNFLDLQIIESTPWDASSHRRYENLTSNIVFFPGFRQIEELPRFYAHAGAFVHTSTTEQWGLVVNEAMACRLPVIVSNRVGCATDLVHEGVNGFTFDPYDVEQITGLFTRISAVDFPLSTFGEASRSIIFNWGPDRFASGLERAAYQAIAVGPTRVSWFDKLLLRYLSQR